MDINIFIQVVYFVAAILFILGLKKMSSPVTATGGIVWAGIGMAAASFIAFFTPGVFEHTSNVILIVIAILVGSGIAYITAKRVQMTDMPQMIAIYNGMGGGAAAAIAAVELVKMAGGHSGDGAAAHELSATAQILAVLGALIGAISFSGSAIAFAKLQGIMKKNHSFTNAYGD